jgi:hypothetical protein
VEGADRRLPQRHAPTGVQPTMKHMIEICLEGGQKVNNCLKKKVLAVSPISRISKLHVIQKFVFKNAEKFIETSTISALRAVSKLQKLREIGDST